MPPPERGLIPILTVTSAKIALWENDYDAFMQFWIDVGLYADQNFGFDTDFLTPGRANIARKKDKYDAMLAAGEPPLRMSHSNYKQFTNPGVTACGPDPQRTMQCVPLNAPPELLWFTNVAADQKKTLSYSQPAVGRANTKYLAKPQNGLAITILRILELAQQYIVDDNNTAEAIFKQMKAINDDVRRTQSGATEQKRSLTCIAQLLLFVLTGGTELGGKDTYNKRNDVYRAFVNFEDPKGDVKVRELPEGGRVSRYRGEWAQTLDGAWMPINLPA